MATFDPNNFIKKFPCIDIDDEIYLRDIRFKDADELYNLMSDQRVLEFLSEKNEITSPEAAKSNIQSYSYSFRLVLGIYWCIAERASDKLIGTIGYMQWSTQHQHAELSYQLMPDYWGKYIMSRTLSKLLPFGFEKMSLHRIEAKAMRNNFKSHVLLKKYGFAEECVMRGHYLIRDKFEDILLFSKIAQ